MSPLRLGRAALAVEWRAAPVGAAASLVLTLAGSALPACSAWLTKLLLDELARGRAGDAHRAGLLAVGACLATAAAVALMRVAGYVAALVRQRVIVDVERRLFAKVAGFTGLRYFEEPAFHDRLRLAEQAAEEAPRAVTSFTLETGRMVSTVGSFAGALFVVWPPMVLLLAAAAAVALLAQLSHAKRHATVSERLARVYRRRLFYRSLLTDPRAAKEIRLFGFGRLVHGRLVSALREATDAELAVQAREVIVQSALAVAGGVVTAVGVVVVAAGARSGRFSVGDVALFLAAAAGMQGTLAGVVLQAGPAARATRLFGHYLDVLGAADDLPAGTHVPPAGPATVEFRDVWFRYDQDGPWVLRGVDLVVPAGHAVGLVGLNGAGKSTLVKLLCRFHDPQRGRILWNGVDIRACDPAELRRRVRATFQDYMTYDLTAAENIGLGDVDRLDDRARVRRAARLAEVDATIEALPDGYATMLSRVHEGRGGGVTLSGGQWQRVALARTFMRDDADLVILDEPGAGLDAEAEHRVHQRLRALGRRRTRLLISHRLSALRDADLIVVLSDGRIVERGRHEDLVARDGEYRRLFSLQAEGYRVEVAP